MSSKTDLKGLGKDYEYGFHDSTAGYTFQSGRGLTRDIVERISSISALSAVLVGTILTFSLNGADIRFLAILIISLVIIRRHESNLLNILGNNERRF
jgi:hypothetical protein